MKMCMCAAVVLLAAVSAPAAIQLYWMGYGANPSEIGGCYNVPATSGIGYGEVYPHGNWSVEVAYALSGIAGIPDGSPLITFCLEWTEPTIGENWFNAVLNTGAVNGGTAGQTSPNFDPLSAQSAWLYDQYLGGNTFGIANVNRRAAAVQEAIWSYEDELNVLWSLYPETPGLKTLADAAVLGGWTNQDIYVLNMTWQSDSRNGQDILVKVPEPTSMALLALGGLLLRRKQH